MIALDSFAWRLASHRSRTQGSPKSALPIGAKLKPASRVDIDPECLIDICWNGFGEPDRPRR